MTKVIMLQRFLSKALISCTIQSEDAHQHKTLIINYSLREVDYIRVWQVMHMRLFTVMYICNIVYDKLIIIRSIETRLVAIRGGHCFRIGSPK